MANSSSKKNSKPRETKMIVLATSLVGFAIIGAFVAGSTFAAKRRATLTIPNGVYGTTTIASIDGANTASGQVWIVATCFQNGSPVIYNRVNVPADASTVSLSQGPTEGYKTGQGGANCSAEAKEWNLKRQRWAYLAETTFSVTE